MRSRHATRAVAGVVGLLLGGCRLGWAQEELPMLGVVVGPIHYSPQGKSTSVIALRLASPLVPLGTRHWLLELGVDYGLYPTDGGPRHHLLVSEGQLQLRTGGGPPFQLFGGIGGGFGMRRVDSTATHPHRSLPFSLTFAASAGARFLTAANWGAVGELRLRRTTLFRGWIRELTVGLFLRY